MLYRIATDTCAPGHPQPTSGSSSAPAAPSYAAMESGKPSLTQYRVMLHLKVYMYTAITCIFLHIAEGHGQGHPSQRRGWEGWSP